MSTIRIDRKHALGLERARHLAAHWIGQAEAQFGLRCTHVKGQDYDTIQFSRSGLNGTLFVMADGLQLHAQLGLLLGAFKSNIETGIEQGLDALLKPAARSRSAVGT